MKKFLACTVLTFLLALNFNVQKFNGKDHKGSKKSQFYDD